MLEELKQNLAHEKELVGKIKEVILHLETDKLNEDKHKHTLQSLLHQLTLLNNALPDLLHQISLGEVSSTPLTQKSASTPLATKAKLIKEKVQQKKVGEKKTLPKVEAKTINVSYVSPSDKQKKTITISKKDRKAFLEKLALSESALEGLKKAKKKEKGVKVNKPNPYAKISNKLFRGMSNALVPKFSSLAKDLQKSNIRFMMSTYMSMAIMTTVLAFFLGLGIFATLFLISSSNLIYFWIPLALPFVAFLGFYLYPAGEAGSLQKNITYELPFATIYMAAIIGSDIEPLKIFKIISSSKEYPNVGAEIKKIINQVEIYGYDLVTALKNVAALSSNKKLAELFSGFATNISTGGNLKSYLEKKSENFLLDYRLQRQKYSELAETFMNIYISILIAAPLVLMMMFIIMNVAGLGLGGLGITTLLTISILGIILLNIIFLVVLNFKQPKV